MSKRITFIHLYNDFSGSPLVLSTIIRGMKDRGYNCRLMTSADTDGFLSNLAGVEEAFFPYRFVSNKLIRLIVFFWTQLIIFQKVWQAREEIDVLYINTFLPFGAALAGKIAGLEIIYHIHETSVKPRILKSWLRWVARRCANKSIYVSKYLRIKENLPGVPAYMVYNALGEDFIRQADQSYKSTNAKDSSFEILMLCSLKAYKGVNEFVALAQRLPAQKFNLVLNAQQTEIDRYFQTTILPPNLKIYPSQSNVHPFYQNANLVLNLSHPEQWVETFGMTLLEGMIYGVPCIVPQVGGPAEVVQHGLNGYQLDQRDLDSIVCHIANLVRDRQLYDKLADNARKRAKDFTYKNMIKSVQLIIDNSLEDRSSAQFQSLIY